MTWTYDSEDLSFDLYKVRWLVGDTNTSDQLVTDEEIEFALTEQGSIYAAGAMVCDTIAAQFAREADQKEVGDLKLRYIKRGEEYTRLADRLRASVSTSGSGGGVSIYAGGISVADKNVDEGNTDRVPPKFTRNLHMNDSLATDTSGYLTAEQEV